MIKCSDALVMLKSRAERAERSRSSSQVSSASTGGGAPSSFYIVPRFSPIYFRLLVDGFKREEVNLPRSGETIQQCFDSASTGTALCLLRRSDIEEPDRQKKPPRLVVRVGQGGVISKADVRTIASRAQKKGYCACDVTELLIERDYEACS